LLSDVEDMVRLDISRGIGSERGMMFTEKGSFYQCLIGAELQVSQ